MCHKLIIIDINRKNKCSKPCPGKFLNICNIMCMYVYIYIYVCVCVCVCVCVFIGYDMWEAVVVC